MSREPSAGAVWLTGLVLELAKITDFKKTMGLVSMGTVEGTSGTFEIFGVQKSPEAKVSPLVQTEVWRLYAASLPSGQIGLMKIAATPSANAQLERESNLLRALQAESERIDRVMTAYGEKLHNYGAQFPAVVETTDAEGRFAMFLGFHPTIASYKQFIPLSLALRDQRCDLQTIVWILGKLLRLLDFAHQFGLVSVGQVDASNILLETDQHGVFVFDWSSAQKDPTDKECLAEVSQAAKIAWWAVGGTEEKEPPHDPEIMSADNHRVFIMFLRELMDGTTDASDAHSDLYDLANKIWPKEEKTDESGTVTKRPFHPWVTYPHTTEV